MYGVLYEQWDETDILDDLDPSSSGAGLAVNDRAEGYHLGGRISSQTTPGWT